MGMYTEFHFNSRLRVDVPQDVIAILEYMLGGGEKPAPPNHPLFATDRWDFMLRSDSYYFDADTHSTLRFDDISRAYFLCIRCNLKNYTGEIQAFLSWITPYLDGSDGNFLGFSRFEEVDTPTLIYL